MDADKRTLRGSSWRDRFKLGHKSLPTRFYAVDVDLALVEKSPPGLVAILDYKHPNDRLTFAEVLAYNAMTQFLPVYIIIGLPDGPFDVFRYLEGNPAPDPPTVRLELVRTCQDWAEFAGFEAELRERYRQEGAHARMIPPEKT